MSFGFSIGDFIAVGEVIAILIEGLRETGGSKSDYQELVRELQSLEKALKHVDNVSTSRGSSIELDGVKCAALLCRYPLEEFLKTISKFENSLGSRAPRGIRSVGRKIQWAFTKKDEVRKLLGYLSIHTNSINMMLLTLGLEASDLANKRTEENHSSMKNLIEDTRIDILNTKMSITTIQDSFMNQSLLASSSQAMITSLSDIIDGHVVLPLKSLGDMTTQNFTSTQQMLRMASEIRGMLPSVDTRFTYFQAPVKVEDALGRFFPVPSEYSFDDLRAIIHSRFREGPGQYQVSSGNYEILNGKNRKQVMYAGYCERRGFIPGSTLTMAIILDDVLKHGDDFCPMPRCGSRTSSTVIGGGRTCDECGIWFDSDSGLRRREPSNRISSVFESPIVDTSSGSEIPLKTSQRQLDDIDDLMAFRNIKIGGLVKLKGKYKYGCKNCEANTDLCQYGDTVSQHFLGRTGKAFVFTDVVNISLGKPEERKTRIGRYVTRNISCRACATEVGWRYDYALDDAEKYPEGKYLLETCLIQPATEVTERIKNISNSPQEKHRIQLLRQVQRQYEQMQKETDRQPSSER